MPQNQGELDATLLIEDKRENLINNLASSWIYERSCSRTSDWVIILTTLPKDSRSPCVGATSGRFVGGGCVVVVDS